MTAATALPIVEPFEALGPSTDRDWLERRASGIGASEAAMLLGQHPTHGEGGPAILWAQKIGRAPPEDLDDVEYIRWGHVMEPVIVEQYGSARYTGRRVEKANTHLRSREHPWALCTLDAWTWHPALGRIPLEVKNVGLYQADRWDRGTPIEMWWQLQHQMLVTGDRCASIAACVGGNSLWWEDVPRHDGAIDELVMRGAEFWRCVQENRVPLHVPTLASVRALYPAGEESGSVQLSGDEWAERDARRLLLKDEIKERAAELDALEAQLKDAIGAHEQGVLDDGTTFTHRTQTRAEITTPATSFRVLRRKKGR